MSVCVRLMLGSPHRRLVLHHSRQFPRVPRLDGRWPFVGTNQVYENPGASIELTDSPEVYLPPGRPSYVGAGSLIRLSGVGARMGVGFEGKGDPLEAGKCRERTGLHCDQGLCYPLLSAIWTAVERKWESFGNRLGPSRYLVLAGTSYGDDDLPPTQLPLRLHPYATTERSPLLPCTKVYCPLPLCNKGTKRQLL